MGAIVYLGGCTGEAEIRSNLSLQETLLALTVKVIFLLSWQLSMHARIQFSSLNLKQIRWIQHMFQTSWWFWKSSVESTLQRFCVHESLILELNSLTHKRLIFTFTCFICWGYSCGSRDHCYYANTTDQVQKNKTLPNMLKGDTLCSRASTTSNTTFQNLNITLNIYSNVIMISNR